MITGRGVSPCYDYSLSKNSTQLRVNKSSYCFYYFRTDMISIVMCQCLSRVRLPSRSSKLGNGLVIYIMKFLMLVCLESMTILRWKEMLFDCVSRILTITKPSASPSRWALSIKTKRKLAIRKFEINQMFCCYWKYFLLNHKHGQKSRSGVD